MIKLKPNANTKRFIEDFPYEVKLVTWFDVLLFRIKLLFCSDLRRMSSRWSASSRAYTKLKKQEGKSNKK